MMDRSISLFSGLALVCLLASVSACSSDDDDDKGGDANSGQALYSGNCSVCHGSKGQGDIGANITGSTTAGIGSWTNAQFITAVRTGVDDEGEQLCAKMPMFSSGQLSDAQLTSIHDYLLTQMNDTPHEPNCD